MAPEPSETLNEVCAQHEYEKSTEFYTWTRLSKIIVWPWFFWMINYYVVTAAALYMYAFGLFPEPIKTLTVAWVFVVGMGTFVGTTAGAHRLWTHRAYKAKLPLRVLLMILYAVMGLTPLYYWIRDHRVHHKYAETDADPHNAKRGFFFSHCGWLIMRRHPECLRRSREIDMSDIEADPVVMFHKRYSDVFRVMLCFVVPTVIPILLWQESILHAVLSQCFIRYIIVLNCVLSINSVTHLWGSRPYNRFINPTENAIVSLLTAGEGSHNYHHTFPWDYKASEFPNKIFNGTTLFIDAMAKLGWAYDLRAPSPELVEQVVRRLGSKSNIKGVH